MNAVFKTLAADRIVIRSALVSVGIIGLGALIAGIVYRDLPPLVPIFNQKSWGIERLGSREEFFIPVGIALLVLFINSICVHILYLKKLPLVARIVSVTSLVVAILSFLFIFRTLQTIY